MNMCFAADMSSWWGGGLGFGRDGVLHVYRWPLFEGDPVRDGIRTKHLEYQPPEHSIVLRGLGARDEQDRRDVALLADKVSICFPRPADEALHAVVGERP